MIKSKTGQRGGIIKLVIYVFIILIILAYFGLNLRGIVGSNTFQDNWSFVRGGAETAWSKYLSSPVTYLYSKIFIPLIWDPAIDGLTRMKTEGTPVVTQSQTPQMPSPSAAGIQ